MAWADEFRRLKVRTNADTPADAKKARELGAEGIGLCRTEHMFFDPERIAAFREMICSDTCLLYTSKGTRENHSLCKGRKTSKQPAYGRKQSIFVR